MKDRLVRAFRRAQYAAIGAAVGAFVGGLLGRSTASTGAATGALVGAIIGEKRHSVEGTLKQLKERDSEEEESGRLAGWRKREKEAAD